VARADRRLGAGEQLHAGAQALGRDDIAALAIRVDQQRDVRAAVRVVLQALDPRDDAVLVRAPEVHDAVVPLVPAPLVAHGDAPEVIAAGLPDLLLEQALHGLA